MFIQPGMWAVSQLSRRLLVTTHPCAFDQCDFRVTPTYPGADTQQPATWGLSGHTTHRWISSPTSETLCRDGVNTALPPPVQLNSSQAKSTPYSHTHTHTHQIDWSPLLSAVIPNPNSLFNKPPPLSVHFLPPLVFPPSTNYEGGLSH